MLIYLLELCLVFGWASCIRPRGVGAQLAPFYNPSADFSCMDGSGSIPFIQVNDDYCDCDDGSDEPGTAACPNGKFFCENKGHSSLVIPSSRVNDGICDCCDGSDEWDSQGKCQDICMELGREAREAALEAARIAAQGFNIKQGMINEAQKLQEERSQQISDKEQEKADLEASKDEKLKAKEEAETPEKEALDFYRQLEEEERKKKTELEELAREVEAEQLFSTLDTNGDGVIIAEELQARPGLDTDKDGVVSVEEAQFFMSGNEELSLDTFKTVGFALLKPYLDLEQQKEDPTPAATEELEYESGSDLPDIVDPGKQDEPEVYDPWRQNQQNLDEHEDVDAFDEDEDDEENDDEEEDEDYDVHDMQDEHQVPPPQDTGAPHQPGIEARYDDKTRSLIAAADAARREYEDVERRLRDLDREINKLKEGMEKDYGEQGEYMVLAGQCFEYTDNEYTYKMCPFDSCSQRNKNGGVETRLGSWGQWEDSQGVRYSKMKYTGGQGCWNGPARSAAVHLHCGTQNTLTSVTEPNRCEYEMHFLTPAACQKPEPGLHDEL